MVHQLRPHHRCLTNHPRTLQPPAANTHSLPRLQGPWGAGDQGSRWGRGRVSAAHWPPPAPQVLVRAQEQNQAVKPLVVIPLLSHLCQPWHEGVERNWAPRDLGGPPPRPQSPSSTGWGPRLAQGCWGDTGREVGRKPCPRTGGAVKAP